jgi:hypothetical protein
MTSLKSAILVLVCLACAAPDDAVCVHPTRGESRAVSLEAVARAQEDVRRRFALTWDKALQLTPETPYDSGLPACRARLTKRVHTTVPPELVGKSIVFAPAERMPMADIRVATSARRLLEVQADALADPVLSERLGVRCSPTLVRAVSEVELELLENP